MKKAKKGNGNILTVVYCYFCVLSITQIQSWHVSYAHKQPYVFELLGVMEKKYDCMTTLKPTSLWS